MYLFLKRKMRDMQGKPSPCGHLAWIKTHHWEMDTLLEITNHSQKEGEKREVAGGGGGGGER